MTASTESIKTALALPGVLDWERAIVQAIATAHKGIMSVQSHPGLGSTFTVRLPLDR